METKRVGILGGAGWPSTLDYYRLLNTYYGEIRGEGHSLDLVIRSIDIIVVRDLYEQGDIKGALKIVNEAIKDCELAGAQFLALACNSLHVFMPEIQRETKWLLPKKIKRRRSRA